MAGKLHMPAAYKRKKASAYRRGCTVQVVVIFVCCRVRMSFLSYLEMWTEQANQRAYSVVAAKVSQSEGS